jgi:hypothetical protein
VAFLQLVEKSDTRSPQKLEVFLLIIIAHYTGKASCNLPVLWSAMCGSMGCCGKFFFAPIDENGGL